MINAMGRVFMNQLDSPFTKLDELLDGAADPLPPIRILDFHCEITSEKNAMGWYLDGRVTGVVGTHTHVPTADARVLPGGTAYISDIGMTGPRDSVIGFSLETRAAALHAPPADPLRRGGWSGELQRGRHHRRSPNGPRQRHRAGAAPGRGLERGRVRTRIPRHLTGRGCHRPWWASSARPPRARRTWPWPSRSACRSRSWSPTRARCTAAWTSAPPSRMRPRGRRCRTTSRPGRSGRAVHRGRLGRAGAAASSPRSRLAAACRCSWAGPACTSAR